MSAVVAEGLSATELARLMAADMERLVKTLLPSGRRVGREWHVGDVFGSAGDSLKIVLVGPKRGRWSDFASGESGDALGLVKACLQNTIQEACRWAEDFLGEPGRPGSPSNKFDRSPTLPPERPRPERSPSARIQQLWESGTKVAGTLGEAYLRSRRIVIPPGPWVRFLAELPYWHEVDGKNTKLGSLPALLCGVTRWPATEVVAVHRIYLAPDGAGKARIPDPGLPSKLLDPKKTIGVNMKGAVRLSRFVDGGDLLLTEGVETGLSALQLFIEEGRRPAVWACLGTAALGAVELPEKIGRFGIAADPNDPGNKAARTVLQRVRRTRPGVRPQLFDQPPGLNDDWNDFLQRRGDNA